MPCQFFSGGGCGGCDHFVKSTSVVVAAGVMTITVPNTVLPLRNHEKFCVCIAQAIPATATPNTTVVVAVGATLLPLFTKCGNKVYADQVRSRKVLHLFAATDVPSAVIDRSELCCTDHAFPVLTAPVVVE